MILFVDQKHCISVECDAYTENFLFFFIIYVCIYLSMTASLPKENQLNKDVIIQQKKKKINTIW